MDVSSDTHVSNTTWTEREYGRGKGQGRIGKNGRGRERGWGKEEWKGGGYEGEEEK